MGPRGEVRTGRGPASSISVSPSSEPRAAPCAHTVRVPFCDPYDVVYAPHQLARLSSQIAPGALGAVELDAEGRLYVTDIGAHCVLRIAPRAL